MHEDLAVDDKTVVFGELFCPRLAVTLKSPIVAVESAPKDGSAVLIEILLGQDTIFHEDQANGIVALVVYRNAVSSDDIGNIAAYIGGKCSLIFGDDALCGAMNGKTAVIFTNAVCKS